MTPQVSDPVEEALGELREVLGGSARPVVSFATGATYENLFRRMAEEIRSGELDLVSCVVTHPDEYLGYGPDTEGGMAHEMIAACPPLGGMLKRGTFLPVPGTDDGASLEAHRARILRAGGVDLQFLGIGRNGHLAFNEPGSVVEDGFRTVRLSESTRLAARARFPGREVPEVAITAGLGELLRSRRVVLMALGSHKAEAVRAMLEGEIGPSCPASYLRRHGNVRVLLDGPAAALLREKP